MKRFNPEKFLKNKYNHLLTAMILLFVFSPSLEVRDPEQKFPLVSLVVLVVLVAAIRTGFPKGGYLYSFLGVVFIGFILNLLAFFLPPSQSALAGVLIFIHRSISVLFYLVTIYLLSKRLFHTHKVTSDTIKGGICAYLLIGFAWATLYSLLIQVNPESFTISAGKEMMYVHFSFTTLTTLGYGDIVPRTRFAAILTNSEAILGQLYLTIFVARLVGLYIVEERENLPQK
jgi:hypothetical protein